MPTTGTGEPTPQGGAPEQPGQSPTGQPEPQPGQQGQQGPVPYDRFQQVIQERNDLKTRLEALEQKQRDAETAAATEQGKWQELYEATKPKADALERYEKTVQEMLKARLEQIPEALRGLVPEGPALDQWLWLERAAAAGMFGQPQDQAPRAPGVPPSGPRQAPAPTITKAQMANPAWVREHQDEIRQAAREGRLER